MSGAPARALFAVLAVAGAGPALGARKVEVAPAPAWVEAMPVPAAPAPAPGDAQGGVDYLLVADQVRATSGGLERHHRIVQRVLSSRGLDEASELRVDFDPSYQSLTLHEVTIRRGGARLPALRPGDVKVIQREPDLDRRIYDGRLTAVVFLRGVRPGDVVDAAWTVRGQNPVFGGRWAGGFQVGWGVPVARAVLRLLWPEGRRLAWRAHGIELPPARAVRAGEVELRWARDGVQAVVPESNLPAGADPFPWLELSEWESWGEVARWAAPIYAAGALGPELEGRLAGWRALPDEAARARAALRFVQDEIRYLGIEPGASSHRPSAPAEVVARRFGDCKDKSLLLASLLGAMGIEARAALVNTDDRRAIAGLLPSPRAFDHVIVRARVAGEVRWLEPTRSLERAPIAEVEPPDYGLALVVDGATAGLAELPAATPRPLTVESTWRVAAWGAPVRFEVVTRYEGLRAVRMRRTLAESAPATLARHYLDYYAHDEPGIELEAPLEIRDEPGSDRVTVVERYRLPAWAAGVDRDFLAEEIRRELALPATVLRQRPLGIDHPVLIRERHRIELPGPPDLAADVREVKSAAAHLTRRAHPEGHAYVVDFEYRTLREALEPGEVPAHLARLREMRDAVGYGLELSVRAPRRAPPPAAAPAGHAPLAIALLVAVLGGGAVAFVLGSAAWNGDLRRWRDAARQRRRRRAFASSFAAAPGETPEQAIPMPSAEAARGLRLRCACGAALPPGGQALEAFRFGDRELHVLRAACARCQRLTRLYLAIGP